MAVTVESIRYKFSVEPNTTIHWMTDTAHVEDENELEIDPIYEAQINQEDWGLEIVLGAESGSPQETRKLASDFQKSLWNLMERKLGCPMNWFVENRRLVDVLSSNLKCFGTKMAGGAQHPCRFTITIQIRKHLKVAAAPRWHTIDMGFKTETQ